MVRVGHQCVGATMLTRLNYLKMKLRTLANPIVVAFGRFYRNFWPNDTAPSQTQTECRDFFDRRDEIGKDFWNDLGSAHPSCECEAVSVRSDSPGPVLNEEELITVVTSKSFVALDGRVEPTLFDSRISNGISTDRKIHTTREDYDMRAVSLIAGNGKKSNCGSIALSVKIIRSILHEGDRAIAVYDTGLPDNPSHAEIACTEVPSADTPGRKKLRAKIRKSVLDATLHDGFVRESSALF